MDGDINNIIEEIQRDNEIIAIVGTINPKVKMYPIYPKDIVNGLLEKTKNIIVREVDSSNTETAKLSTCSYQYYYI